MNPELASKNGLEADFCDRLCSYEDVRKSYPTPDPPINIESDEEIEAWWVQFYDQEVGVLHRIKWHRIVIDGVFVIRGMRVSVDKSLSLEQRAMSSKIRTLPPLSQFELSRQLTNGF